jgi:hypothetical protein
MIGAAALKLVCEFVFDNPIGKAVAGGVLVAGVFFTWLAFHDATVATNATTELVSTLNSDAEKKAHEAAQARAPADRPGAAQRLRSPTHCRDC